MSPSGNAISPSQRKPANGSHVDDLTARVERTTHHPDQANDSSSATAGSSSNDSTSTRRSLVCKARLVRSRSVSGHTPCLPLPGLTCANYGLACGATDRMTTAKNVQNVRVQFGGSIGNGVAHGGELVISPYHSSFTYESLAQLWASRQGQGTNARSILMSLHTTCCTCAIHDICPRACIDRVIAQLGDMYANPNGHLRSRCS